jgi:polyhydroxyalkanoate synthesis regulator phasin
MDDIRADMLKGWKSSWESYAKTLTMMQEQGERMLDLLLVQGDAGHDEAKKLIKEGVANTQQAQKSYVQAVEDNLQKIEELIGEDRTPASAQRPDSAATA